MIADLGWTDIVTGFFTGAGLLFFFAGTAGLIRFPDTPSRLHALTKADNVGLGLLIVGLSFQAPDLQAIGKLALIWVMALIAAGTTAQLVARSALLADQAEAERTRKAGPQPSGSLAGGPSGQPPA